MRYAEKLKDIELQEFQPEDFSEIENLAKGLSEEEVLLYYGYEKLDELPEADRKWFVIAFNRGRIKGKREAVDALFIDMKGKQGAAASLSYLKRFGEKWQSEINDGEGKDGLTFTVHMPPSD